MIFRRRAYTLVEMLVVLAVVAVVCAILFPVFSQARAAAQLTSCLSRFRQVMTATHVYLDDYDDLFMPVNHDPGAPPNPVTDRTWVQMLLPYTADAGSFRTFRCPADSTSFDDNDEIFDQDLVPGDLMDRYYTASMHVNTGYNFQYLAPILKTSGGWASEPKAGSSLLNPAGMFLFVDSAWSVVDGRPMGGGNWLVSPPCRYEEVGNRTFDTIANQAVDAKHRQPSDKVYAPLGGWQPDSDPGLLYGGAWPWHLGRVNVVTVEGTSRSLDVSQLVAGCTVLPNWSGAITDRRSYGWSPE